jgi:hypothetical protein
VPHEDDRLPARPPRLDKRGDVLLARGVVAMTPIRRVTERLLNVDDDECGAIRHLVEASRSGLHHHRSPLADSDAEPRTRMTRYL